MGHGLTAMNRSNPILAAADPLNLAHWGSGGAPDAPDFNAAAEKQAVTAHPNQSNPFASSQWTQDPKTGQWTQNVALSSGLQGNVSNLENQIANQGPLGTGDQAREQAINAIYGQSQSRLDPQWKMQEEQMRSQLAAQGLDPASEAGQAELGAFGRNKNDAYQSAMNNAIQGGTAAQQATFGENLAAQQAPYQQLGQLASIGQGASSNFAQNTATQYLPAAAAQYQGALQGYGIQNAGKNSGMSGAAQMAPLVAAMFSGGAGAAAGGAAAAGG